ncbi:hypothetical protein [Burkholderia ambifaria]|uniref:hypothetical protein n=1 Tax=Burkholderia ambifaria TaxID=152480 RepID=UPI00158C975B|nr:hypothetical protein [Burkholderia ambifaria]
MVRMRVSALNTWAARIFQRRLTDADRIAAQLEFGERQHEAGETSSNGGGCRRAALPDARHAGPRHAIATNAIPCSNLSGALRSSSGQLFRDVRSALLEDGENYILASRLGVLAGELYQNGWTRE